MWTTQRLSSLIVSLVLSLATSIGLFGLVSPAESRPAQTSRFEVVTWGRATGPGAIVTHSLEVSSVGLAGDTISFEIVDSLWPVVAPDVVLPPGGEASVFVTVTVPFEAPDRSLDSARIIATSRQSGTQRSFTLTSRTGGVFRADRYTGCRFDLDSDGLISADDVNTVAERSGAEQGQPLYRRSLDLDHSGRIDHRDERAVQNRVGATCRTLPRTDTTALQRAITGDGLRDHLVALQAVAEANGGHRAVGSTGYAGSLDYVEGALNEVGLATMRHEFDYPVFEIKEAPRARIVSPEPRQLGSSDIRLLGYSGSGDVTALVQAVDVQIPPGQRANSSTSGCQVPDFDGFPNGRIALVQRGGCSFALKARYAEEAGASALVVFNEGQEGRTAVFESTLDGPQATIPAFSASFELGETLVGAMAQGDAIVMHLFADTLSTYRPSHSLTADLPGESADVVMLGAHLDSVPAGPGINDNGSGATTVLEIARQMARMNLTPANTVRFAFWGAEEIGLVGSEAYAASLTPDERRGMLLNLNFDMLGSTNWSRFVYQGGESSQNNRPEGSAEIEAVFVRHFGHLGLPVMTVNIDGRSDHGSFTAVGIPVGGLHTGTSVKKSEREVELFGGRAGQPYDPCYHEACDTVDNIDWAILEEMADAAADAALKYAMDDGFAYRYEGDREPAPSNAVFVPVVGRGGWYASSGR